MNATALLETKVMEKRKAGNNNNMKLAKNIFIFQQLVHPLKRSMTLPSLFQINKTLEKRKNNTIKV